MEDMVNREHFIDKYDYFYTFCKEIFNVEKSDGEELEKLLEMRDRILENNMI